MAENTLTTLNGLTKRVYGPDVETPIPEFAKLQALIGWKPRMQVGERYEIPVVVKLEQGFTYADPSTDGAATLQAAAPGSTQPAYVSPFEIALRSAISYSAAFQAAKKGDAAFRGATSLMLANMGESFRRRLEVGLLGYNRSGVATISATPGANVLTITDATWAPGLWFGMVGCNLQCYSGVTGTDTLRAGGWDGIVTKVDLANKQITVTNQGAAAPGDTLYFYGARTATAWKAALGLEQICTLDTLFGIAGTTYEVFHGVSVAAGGVDLSMDTVLKVMAELAVRGGSGEYKCLCSPKTFKNMVSDLAALVAYDQKPGDKEYVLGAETIKFWTPQGKVSIDAHEMLKEGEAYVFQPARLERSGAVDITFRRDLEGLDAKGNGSFFRELTDAMGFELRAYSNQFLFSPRPAAFAKITGIVNS